MSSEMIAVGLGGAIIGSILSLLGAYVSGRFEIRKITLTYEQRRNDAYIENARSYESDLYVPLYRLVSAMYSCFLEFRDLYALQGGRVSDVGNAALERLRQTHREFESTYQSWQDNGLTVYLIYDLEEKCVLLKNLLARSLSESAIQVQREILVTVSTPVTSFSWPLSLFQKHRFVKRADTSGAKVLPKAVVEPKIGFSVVVGWLRSEVSFRRQVLSAPLVSSDFERQFMEYVTVIKDTVREVTLGRK